MDLAQRLNHLESVHDWQGLVEELEKGIAAEGDATRKAAYHLKLGRLLEEKFLQAVKALKHFQDAYKLNPALLEALESARSIYWDLGKTNMVQKLLELELRNAPEGTTAAELRVELGDVLCDAGDFERATEMYAKGLAASGGTSEEARACLFDMQVDQSSWSARMAELVDAADAVASADERKRLLLRAARLAKRFDRGQLEDLLRRAYETAPSDKQAAAMFEGLLVEAERPQAIVETQRRILDGRAGVARGEAAFKFGVRWATRHQNVEIGSKLLEESLRFDPSNEAAFAYLRELWGTKEGNWERVALLAESAANQNGSSPYMIAQAGGIAWRQLGNLIRARSWFERLSAVAPTHPSVSAFEAQIGERLTAAPVAPSAPPPSAAAPAPVVVAPAPVVVAPAPVVVAPVAPAPVAVAPADATPLPTSAPAPVSGPAPVSAPAPVSGRASAPASGPVGDSSVDERDARSSARSSVADIEPPPPARAPAESRPADSEVGRRPTAPPPPGAEVAGRVEELKAKAQKQEQAKRYNEYVKTLIEIAEAVSDPAEKIDNYAKAAELYSGKFSNAAEAVKCYEAILAIDGEHAQAIDFLRQSYEKRRDWEKLIGLLRREAAALPEGGDRAAKYLEIAKLASERVKKVDFCIELWDEVLANDPENPEALNALAGLYEKNKDYQAFARVLQKQVDTTFDSTQKLALLSKLAQLYGERLKDDEAAVKAWQEVIALNPQDRKAQEALKKAYLQLQRWDDLEVFYAESGKWDEFIRVLESQEAKETDDAAKISLLVKIAELWMVQKQKADRAARAYEKVLSIDGSHLAAAEALIPIYTQANNSKGLAGAIEVKLSHDQDDVSRLDLYRQVAALYETRLKEPQRAFERYLSAFQIAPQDEQCIDDVERAARSTEGWDALIQSYSSAIERAEGEGDIALGVDLRLRLGRVLLDEVKRIDEALSQFRAVYEADGENQAAIGALERLYRETGRFGELLGIYEKKLGIVTEPEERKQILYAIAELYEGELRDAAQAIGTYRQVLDDEPTDPQALAALDKLYREQQDWESYVDVLRKRIDSPLDEQALIDLKFRLGSTLEKHLNDAAGALENYKEILILDPGNDEARLALEALLSNESLRAEAAAILQEIYEGRGDWERLIQALEILAAAEGDTATRVALLRKVARTAAESLSDLGRAFDAQSRALKDDPSHAETRAELESLAAQAGAWDRLDVIFSEIADSLSDARLSREYWMRLGSIHERLGKVEEAANGYLRVLSIDPADSEALEAMDELYRRTERWGDLIGVYRRRIELVHEPTEREGLYAQMAEVYEQRLGQPEEAIAAYREVLSIDNTSMVALAALDGLFSRQGMWEELADNLEAQLGIAVEEEAQIRLMLRLAALRESRMRLVDSAIDIYRQVLEREPTNVEALGALERLGKVAEHELAIAEILEPLYRQSGDFQKLIGVHEVQVRRSDDVTRRVELLHQIAVLYEDAGGDLSSAFDTYARALSQDPASESTQEGLDRLARATGRFADLARVFETLAAQQTDAELASSLYTMSARIYEGDLGDMDSAVGHYRRVLEIDPRNLHAAESLERLFRTSERYNELSQILQQKADILDDLSEKKLALFQAASLEEEVLERHDQAIAVYGKVLELDAEDLRAIDALTKLYLSLSRWQELLSVYAKKADLVLDSNEKKRIYYQIGAVYERELGNVASAIDTYQRVLEIDPDDLQALGRLDVLYQTSQNWLELLSVLQHEAEITADPAEGISYQYRIAELYEKHLDDVSRAIELYRDLLQQMPDHEPTLQALEQIKDGSREPLGAALVLEPIYDASGEWQKLISVLEVRVKVAEDPYEKVDLLHRVARLSEEMLSDHVTAFETYARAVTCDIGNEESLSNLERLAMMVNRWPQVAALYDTELGRLGEEPARFVELGLRLAQIFETQLDDIDSAVARYRRVLEVEPENQTAIASLDRLFTATERWGDLVTILSRESEIAQSPDEILEFKYRLGVVYQTRLNDLPAAIGAYREVLTAAPEHSPTLEALEGLFAAGIKQIEIGAILEPLYQAAAEWEKLGGVLEAELTHLTEAQERQAMYYRLGELQEERLISPDGALAVFMRALKEYPGDEKTLEEVERLAGSVDGGWEMLANAYADVLGIHSDKDVQTGIGKRLARVFETDLSDVAKAEETYRYVLGIEPLEAEALSNLDRIYTQLEQYPELASVLEQRVRATEDRPELVDLYLRLGQTYEERLGQLDDAIRAFRRIFDELETTNEQAISALERIYTAKGAWTQLKVVLERELENAMGDSQEADIRAKMAHLLADRLNDVQGAVETWKRVLDLRGEDPEALGALSNLYERVGQWSELCDVLERHYDIAIDDESRVAVLLRRAKLFHEQLGRDDSSLDDYQRVLDIDYANLEALYAIAAIWRLRNEPEQIVSSLHQTVDRARDVLPAENVIALYRELGTTYQHVLGQAYDAIDAWRKLLEVDPKDFEAMAALENLLRAEGRWVEVIDVKMGRAAAYESPADKVREYLEVAQIWEHQVEEKDRGTLAYEKVLELEPTHDQAFAALEELHDAARRSEPLIELYLARLESREEVSDKTDILRKVARVFEEQLEDKPQAFDALLTAFEMDFSDMDTVRYLERMAQATNRWPELVQTVNGWLQQQTAPLQKITLCLRLAKWYAEDLGHPEYAQPYYQQILAHDPNNVAVLRQMANFFKKTGQWQQQGQMLTSALNVAVTDVDRKEVLTELGEVLERHMGEVEQGLSFYRRALDVDPLHLPALEALERIYTDRDQPNDLVDVLLRKARAVNESDVVAAVKLRTAGLYESKLGLIEKAGAVYREVLDIDASNLLAMRGLERVYTATHQWPDLVRVLEMQLDVVTTERERIDVLMKIATLQEEQFLKPDLSAARLEQVVEIDPSHEPALEALERCYRRLRQWHDLISTYDRHINAAEDRQKKIELWSHTAKVYAEEIEDLDRAIDAYLNIVDIQDTHIPALEALAKLYEKQDNTAKAIEYMTRVADLTVDGKQRVEMYFRIGRQLDEKLGERVQAQERFEMALDLDPSHVPTLAALRVIAIDAADWDRAARYLDQEQMNTDAPRAKARLLVELGKLRDDMLGEHALAVQAYEMALQSDPDNEDAAMPLLNEYVSTERWAQAEPLAEMLVRKSGKRDRSEQHRLQRTFGRVLDRLGKDDASLKAYTAAHNLDLTDQETIRGLADVSFKLGDWASALTNYQKVLTSLDEAETEERATVYYKLGCIKQAQGQSKQAVNNFEKALGADPAHRPTLEAMVAVYEALKDWKQVCHYKRLILDNIMDGAERFKMLNDIGDIWVDRENNIPKGVEALEEALDLEPQNHVLLHKLLQLYQRTGQWERMVDCLQRIAELEPQPDRKSRYLYTMAQIYRDKLDDPARAVELFNDTLDLNPHSLEAFERINKILTAQKEWKQLERAYRKMLHRVAGKGNTDLEYSLWHALGLIYRDRLGDRTAALETFRMASRLKPEDATEHLILAELYEQSEQFDLATGEFQAMVKIDPMKIDPYKRLYRLYVDSKRYDQAWCVAAALSFLRKADPDEQQYFEDYRPQGLIQAKSRLDNEQWIRNLFHEEENLYVGKIFEMIAGAALRAKIETLKQRRELPVLDQRFLQDPATSTVTFARTFGWAANVLGLPAPRLYVRSDVPGALVAVANEQPASVAGQTVLTGFSPQELTFIVGKHLAMYRGEHYIKTLFPTVTELTVLLFAGIKLVAPDTSVPPDIEKQITATAQTLRGFMQPMQLEGLRMVVKKFLAEGAKANIKRWVQCVDITAARTGLLLSGDLEIAKKIIAAEPQQPGDLPPQDRLKELIVFSTSDQYFALRQALGIAIGEG
ncbi:tetratricopeptide repeat protein [Sorangium sp. So ce281]|uniref:tetratricopeptide repeat protein n=1 Tax=unclassified Sorangium TaxID=2621164 RepID=UPI003F5D8EFE